MKRLAQRRRWPGAELGDGHLAADYYYGSVRLPTLSNSGLAVPKQRLNDRRAPIRLSRGFMIMMVNVAMDDPVQAPACSWESWTQGG